MSNVNNNPHEIPKVVSRTDASRYETLRYEKIEEFQVISLTKDRKTGKTLWRHRFSVASNNMSQTGDFQDYPREQFKNFRAFKKFVQAKPPIEGQKFAWGTYRAKNKDSQPI